MLRTLYFLSMLFVITSCVDLTIDEPPACCADSDIETNASIADIKALYKSGQFIQIAEDLVFDAIVSADDESGNLYKGLIIQDETAGIEIRIDQTNLYSTLPVGRKVFIKAKDLYIGDYNGTIQLGHSVSGNSMLGIPAGVLEDFITATTSANIVEIVDATISSLGNDMLSRVVRLKDVEFVNTNTSYADAINQQTKNVDLSDCNDNMLVVRTSGFADFAGEMVPNGNGELIGVYSIFGTTKQLLIRDLDDVNMNGDRCDGGSGGTMCEGVPLGTAVDSVDEDFTSLNDQANVSLPGWSNFFCQGERVWRAREFDGNIYAQATAFNDTSPAMETYLITPPINFNGKKKLSFRSAIAFYEHDGLQVMVSVDYDGSDAAAATWDVLDVPLAGSSNSNYEWVPSGTVDLSSYTKQGVIAFKYDGTAGGNTTSAIIDDIKVFE